MNFFSESWFYLKQIWQKSGNSSWVGEGDIREPWYDGIVIAAIVFYRFIVCRLSRTRTNNGERRRTMANDGKRWR